jgi:hypothetical protein
MTATAKASARSVNRRINDAQGRRPKRSIGRKVRDWYGNWKARRAVRTWRPSRDTNEDALDVMEELDNADSLVKQYEDDLDELEQELDFMEVAGYEEDDLDAQRVIIEREKSKARWDKMRKAKGAMSDIVIEARVHFGAMKATSANKQALRRFILRELPKHDVRKTDKVHVVERVMASVFIPNQDQISSARAIRSSLATIRRMEACYEDPRDSHGTSNLNQTQQH